MGIRKNIFLCTVIVALFLICGIFSISYLSNNFNKWKADKANNLFIQSQNITNEKQKLLIYEQIALLDPTENNFLNAGILAEKLNLGKLSKIYFLRVKTADGFYELGNSYAQLEEYTKAEESYNKAISLKSNSRYYFSLGKVYLKQAKFIEAEKEFSTSNKLNKDFEENSFLLMLSGLIDNGSLSDMESLNLSQSDKDILNKTYSKTEEQVNINYVYDVLKTQGYPQAAFECLVNNGKGSRLDRDGYLELANEYYTRGNYQSCYASLLKAKELDPYYPQTYQHLITVSKLLNKTDDTEKFERAYKFIAW